MITITDCLYANAEKTVAGVAEKLGRTIVTDADILDKTLQTTPMNRTTLQKVIESRKIEFDDFSHEKEKCTAWLKKTISTFASREACIFHGILGHLIPREISHAMRVLIISDKKRRIKNGMANPGLTEKDVIKRMETADTHSSLWTNDLFDKTAWDESLYDIVISTDKLDTAQSVFLITEDAARRSAQKGTLIENETSDFMLMADVGVALSEIGLGLLVTAQKGSVVITIDKKVMMLSKLKQKIINTVREIPGVKSVTTKIGQNYYQGDIIHNYKLTPP